MKTAITSAEPRERWSEDGAPFTGLETRPVPGAPLAVAREPGGARRAGRRPRWTPWFASLLLVSGMALVPRRYLPQDLPFLADKVFHGLTFVWLGLHGAGMVRGRRAAWGVALACFLVGAMIEIIQPYVGRGFSYADMAANGFGAVLGTLAGRRLTDWRRPGSPSAGTSLDRRNG